MINSRTKSPKNQFPQKSISAKKILPRYQSWDKILLPLDEDVNEKYSVGGPGWLTGNSGISSGKLFTNMELERACGYSSSGNPLGGGYRSSKYDDGHENAYNGAMKCNFFSIHRDPLMNQQGVNFTLRSPFSNFNQLCLKQAQLICASVGEKNGIDRRYTKINGAYLDPITHKTLSAGEVKQLPVDRERIPPFLLRIFHKNEGHHDIDDFNLSQVLEKRLNDLETDPDIRSEKELQEAKEKLLERHSLFLEQELQVYCWSDSTLREVADLIMDMLPEAQAECELHFQLVYAGKNVIDYGYNIYCCRKLKQNVNSTFSWFMRVRM
jgi:hypothetical protein